MLLYLFYYLVNHYEVNMIKKIYLIIWAKRDVSYISTEELCGFFGFTHINFFNGFFTYCSINYLI